MKKLNKKGFTIVELVIVIAVIAILAAVMIPTFSGIINRANESAALQDAKSTYTQYLVEHPEAEIDYVEITVDGVATYYSVNDWETKTTTKPATVGDTILKAGTCETENCECGFVVETIAQAQQDGEDAGA